MPDLSKPIRHSLALLLRELLNGPSDNVAFVLNPGDRGLLASLDALSAEAANARPNGRSSVTAHVDHLRYGFELLNRWARGENPWADANYAASWKRQQISEDEWRALRAMLADEARAWTTAIGERREWDDVTMTGDVLDSGRESHDHGVSRKHHRRGAGRRRRRANQFSTLATI